jgi:hypothetical protein
MLALTVRADCGGQGEDMFQVFLGIDVSTGWSLALTGELSGGSRCSPTLPQVP